MTKRRRREQCDGRQTDSRKNFATHDDLRAQVARLRDALVWYADEARALAKHMQAGEHSQAVRVALTALAADGGRRADACLGPNFRVQQPEADCGLDAP